VKELKANKILTDEDVKSLFINLPSILGLNENMLLELKV
jgi:hypothetical protein